MGQTKKVPMRTCTGCRQVKDKKELIRIVCNKENEVFVDITGKQNGRGAYLCKDVECLKKAVKNKGLERTLKISKISDDIIHELSKQIGEDYE